MGDGMGFGQMMVTTRAEEWERIKAADQIRRDRAQYDHAKREADLKANATAATVRNLRQPVIDRLLFRESITQDQHRAAKEIHTIFLAVTRASLCRVGDMDRAGGGGSPGGFVPQIFTCGYQDRYRPWAAEIGGQTMVGGRTLLDMVLMMVVDNYGHKVISQAVGCDHRRALNLIRGALHLYCVKAGWIEERTPQAEAAC
jgi:hypothetical protein